VRLWPRATALPARLDPAVLVARSVSQQGDVVLVRGADEPACLAAGLAELVATAARVVAVVLPEPSTHEAADGHAAPLDCGRRGSDARQADAPCDLVETCADTPALRVAAHRVITEHAVLDVTPDGFVIRELAPGLSARRLQAATAPTLRIAADVAEMAVAMLDNDDDHGVA